MESDQDLRRGLSPVDGSPRDDKQNSAHRSDADGDGSVHEDQLSRPTRALAAASARTRARSRQLQSQAAATVERRLELQTELQAARPAAQRALLLDEDAELAAYIHPDNLAGARERLVARAVTLHVGPWEPPQTASPTRAIGLLMLDGQMLKRVGLRGRYGAELIGPGDLLRPWQHEETESMMAVRTEYRVLEQARLALLDSLVSEQIARYPGLAAAFAAKALARGRSLAITTAIVQQPRIDLRIRLLLWHLADRHGRVRGDGILVPLQVPHAVMAELIGARRPSVTVAVRRLQSQGLVDRLKEGYLLIGDPPEWDDDVPDAPAAGASAGEAGK